MRRPVLPNETRRAQARVVYGADPIAYDAGRPDYPARVYELLRERGGLRPGAAVLEIGPGTGRVTRRLLDAGASVLAVEPDPSLAEHLGAILPAVHVMASPFEVAPLPEQAFDLAVAAMSFHWVDVDRGVPKLRKLLKRGGCAALWWTLFGDPERGDPLGDAVATLLGETATGPRAAVPFELDEQAWSETLHESGGLVDAQSELIHWDAVMDAAATRAFYASTIAVLEHDEPERTRVLDEIENMVRTRFGGSVVRPFVTAVYTARRA